MTKVLAIILIVHGHIWTVCIYGVKLDDCRAVETFKPDPEAMKALGIKIVSERCD
jgi:hypothetical protein